jgi:hypothetical protein
MHGRSDSGNIMMTCSTDGMRLGELDSKKTARAWNRIHVEVTYYRLLVVPNQHAGFVSGILSERTRRQLTTPVLEDVRGTPLTIDVLLKYLRNGLSTSKASNNSAGTIDSRICFDDGFKFVW